MNMKKSKRILSILLALVLVAGFLPITARAADTTIYFRNTGNWANVSAYAWSDTNSAVLGTWPGSAMTLVEDGLYRITVPFGTPNIIFNNTAGTQTSDLTIPADGKNCYDYAAGSWSYYDDGTEDTGSLTVTVGECTGGSLRASCTKANPGDVVSLAATPASGYRLVRWEVRTDSGKEVMVTDNSFVMPEDDVTVTAVFEAVPGRIIYFQNNQNWSGTIYAYAWNTAGDILGSWPGTAMTALEDGLYSITVREDAVNIIFNNNSGTQTGDLTIPTDGKNFYTGSGWTVYATYTVSAASADEAMGTVSGGGSFLHGSAVTLTAIPTSGYKFTGWQENGEIVSTANPYTFTAEGDRTLTAAFAAFIGFDITVAWSEGGTVTGSGVYEQGTTATLTAIPAGGYMFTGWQENGETVSTDNPYSFTVTANRRLTPVFADAESYVVTCEGTNAILSGDAVATVGREYRAMIRTFDEFVVPASISVTIGGVEYTGFTYQRFNRNMGELVIPAQAITGDIIVTAVGETVSGHLIISNLSHITTDSTEFSVEDNAHYYATLTAEKGYKLPDSIHVTMGGEEVTTSSGMLAYNAKTGSVTVRFITADVVITAVAVEAGPQASVKFAEGNTVEYAWLSDALTAVQNTTGATVTLLDDLYTISTLEILDATNLTLDLNGKVIDCVKSCDALTITDSTVIINDSGAAKTGAISSVSGTSAVVLNSGSLTVNGGTFGDATGIELLGGSLTVNGGLLCGTQGLMVDGGAEAVINGGTICGNLTSNTGKGINIKDGTVTINDGTIGNDKGSYMLYLQKAGALYVNGGEFKLRKSYGFYLNTTSVLVLRGGTYTNGIWLSRNTVSKYLDEGVSVLDANGAQVAASSKAIAQYVTIGKQQPPAITFKSLSLSLESEVQYNLYFTVENMNAAASDMGLIVWDEEPKEVTLSSGTVVEGARYDETADRYMVSTEGIPGKMLGDTKYLAVYAKQFDGTCVYSDVHPYSAKTYCLKRMTDASDEKLKALCVALMNYGAAAQTYFDYRTDALMNGDFAAYQHLVVPYAADMMAPRGSVDPAKAGAFGTEKSGFTRRSASMSADGAFAINYYFTASTAAETVTFYYWTEEAYTAAQVLTPENATGSKTMTATQGENQFWANVPGIAAKELDRSIYACGVYEVDGVTYSTGVFAYSLGYYCVNKAENGDARLKPMAEATAVYSYYAKAYFLVTE